VPEDALKNITELEESLDYMVANTNSLPIIVAGRGAVVTDEAGRTYLDFEAGPGVASVGHCHPEVVQSVKAQAERLLQSPGRFHSRLALNLAKRIAALTMDRLKRVFFSNSGAEANDGAVKLALKHATVTGKRGYGIIALEHSFHGRLSLPLSLTGNASRKKGFGPYASFPGIVHVPAPYCYRCPFDKSPTDCQRQCISAVEEALATKVPGEAAIMIAEPILGVGGVIVPPDDYWPTVEEICRKHEITLIHDEVFTGFGRTGKMFAHQHWSSKPDVMTFAKAIGGGLPLGGFIATDKLNAAFDDGDHFTTFGSNNQLGLAAGHAVLDILEKEALPEHAAAMGERLMDGLRRLESRFPFVGDVRGKGLMVGVEIVRDKTSRAPAADIAKRLQAALRERGVIVGITGVHGCVLRMTPPLVISAEQIDETLKRFDEVFAAA
jgi:4-aminobutyrate aminotransferase-like enzyme